MIYNEIKQKPSSFISHTSLHLEEFTVLCHYFETEWVKFYKYHTLEGKKRKHPNHKPYKDTKTLPSIEDKLFFVLCHFKTGIIQEVHASSYALSQAKVSIWLKILIPLLVATLKKMGMTASREHHTLSKAIEKHGYKIFTLDATERRIERDKDQENQKDFYSGKKGDHTIKNNLLCVDSQEIIFLGNTYEGKVHDKKMADLDQIRFPKDSIVRLDLGFLGFEPICSETGGKVTKILPFKKPKGQKLTKEQKDFNKILSQARIVVENAISGVKRLRIVKDRVRHIKRNLRDTILVIAVAIHNFRVRSPFRKYKANKKLFAHMYAGARI